MRFYFLILFIIIILPTTIWAQATVAQQLDTALQLWLKVKNKEALAIYQRVIKTHSQNKPALMEAYYKSGAILEFTQPSLAEPYFHKMIALKLNQAEKQSPIMHQFMGGKASNPYQQYMHLAYSYLGNIAQAQKRYAQALQYYKIANIRYPSWDQKSDMIQLFANQEYAECYAGLNQPDSVLYTLIPYILTSETYAAEGLQSLKKNLQKAGGIPNPTIQLKQALQTITIQEQKQAKAYKYQLKIQLLGKSLLLTTLQKVMPLSTSQQQQKVTEYKEELAFIFKELLKDVHQKQLHKK